MKNKLLTWLLLLTSFAFAQNSASWYKQITGSIDKYPITMHLHKAGHNYYGYYYYESQQKPVYINGEDTSVKDKIKLFGFSTSETTETFTFSVANAAVNGNWKKDEQAKAL